jgi:hypothetical protein
MMMEIAETLARVYLMTGVAFGALAVALVSGRLWRRGFTECATISRNWFALFAGIILILIWPYLVVGVYGDFRRRRRRSAPD